jgi:universal stress protein E
LIKLIPINSPKQPTIKFISSFNFKEAIMTLQINRILAVIDPTTDIQLALSRALPIAEQTGASIHAYLCCYSPLETDHFAALKRAELARHEAWIEKVIETANLGGVDVTTEVEWDKDWRQAVARTTAEYSYDLIVKAASRHSTAGRHLLKTSDWAVLRNSHCPILLVKRESIAPVQRVLIAVNPNVEDPKHQQLIDDIIYIGKQITAERENSELHAVCAYTGEEDFTFPTELAQLIGIDESRAHCVSGSPDDVIVECANLLESELVVLGTVSRTGLGGLTKGNTAERALDRLASDVLVATAA